MLTQFPSVSRQSLKKYVKANNKLTATDSMFDSLFNRALKAGVDKGVFVQPKGKSPCCDHVALRLSIYCIFMQHSYRCLSFC